MKLSIVVRAGLVAIACVLAVAPPVTAQMRVGQGCSVAQDAYGPGLCPNPPTEHGTPPPPGPPKPPSAASLPFTGADAGLAGAAGLLLLLAGVTMRRASAPRRSQP